MRTKLLIVSRKKHTNTYHPLFLLHMVPVTFHRKNTRTGKTLAWHLSSTWKMSSTNQTVNPNQIIEEDDEFQVSCFLPPPFFCAFYMAFLLFFLFEGVRAEKLGFTRGRRGCPALAGFSPSSSLPSSLLCKHMYPYSSFFLPLFGHSKADWDDDEVNDDFIDQLREQIEATKAK